MQGGSILTISPSFSSYTSVRFAEIATKVSEEFINEREEFGLPASFAVIDATKDPDHSDEVTDDEEVEFEFEFSTVCTDHEALTISADDIFDNGQIRPIFNTPSKASSVRVPLEKLLSDERDSQTSSSSSEAVTYCVCCPKSEEQEEEGESIEKCKKSNSTGTSKNWKLRDLIHRSYSDNKETLVFLARSTNCSKSKKREEKIEKKSEVSKERIDFKESTVVEKAKTKRISPDPVASPHEIHYVRNRALKEFDRRRSYLPYRKDLIGFFANVNGLSRNLSPF